MKTKTNFDKFISSRIAMNLILTMGKKNYRTQYELSKELDIYYTNMVKILTYLKNKGFIISEKIGRDTHLKLSNKGLIVHKHLLEIKEELNKNDAT